MRPLSIAENINATTRVDPLPSWNQGKVKATILNFVKNVTNSESTNYIIPEDRIAVLIMMEPCELKNQLISRAFSSSIDLKNCPSQILK
jgi:hypothetical protein